MVQCGSCNGDIRAGLYCSSCNGDIGAGLYCGSCNGDIRAGLYTVAPTLEISGQGCAVVTTAALHRTEVLCHCQMNN